MKHRITYRFSWMIFLLVMFSGCQEDDFLFDISQKDGIYFKTTDNIDSLHYGFGIETVDSVEYKIPVGIIGVQNSKDRKFNFEIVNTSTTAVENIHYSIGETVISANQVDGNLSVILYRNRDTLLKDSVFVLTLKLVENEGFEPRINRQVKLSISDGLAISPKWWDTRYLGNYSPAFIIKFFEFFREFEEVNPDVYKEIIENFGYYLESLPYGSKLFAQNYKAIIGKYVLIPLFNYYEEHPDEKIEYGVTMPDPGSWM